MRIVDTGTGPPVVVIPGIQGRWEWMKPGIDALGARCRVITFSLCDEPSSQCGPGRATAAASDETGGFWRYVEQVRDAMDQAGIESATVCGQSYGGLIACAFAARWPQRARGLVLISALPPSWQPDARVRFYMRAPRLLTPVFMAASIRLYREVALAHPGVLASMREATRHALNVLTHMFSPSLMARRVQLLSHANLGSVVPPALPALVITGEPALDRVVPVQATREYLRWFPHARVVTVERTGHLGFITRPQAFADVVAPFAAENSAAENGATENGATASRRRIG